MALISAKEKNRALILMAQALRDQQAYLIKENTKDLVEIPDTVKNRLDIHPVKWIEQILELALERKPEPLPETTPLPPVAATPTVAGENAVVKH